MGEGVEETKRIHGICDICGRRVIVTLQILDGVIVAAQCKRCEKEKD